MAEPLPRAPRTQQQRRDETRGAILDAAVACLVEQGFARTSTLEVQKRAKVSRGALLHHFPAKAELLTATIEHLAELRGRELKERAASLPLGRARQDAVLDLLWECFSGPLFQVAMELRAAARTDAELRQALTAAELGVRDRIGHQAKALFGPELATHPRFETALDLTLNFMIGAGMTAILHGEQARIRELVTEWKALFTTALERGSR